MTAVFIIGVLALGFLAVWIRPSARDFKRRWRLRYITMGEWMYEERVGNRWTNALTVLRAGDEREAGDVFVYIPEWIHERRTEIVTRVASELKGYSVKDA